eukprot:g7149.t1
MLYVKGPSQGYRLYVGSLDRDTDKRDLEEEFSRYGRISNIWIARNPPGFAFVDMDDRRDAEDAVDALDGIKLLGSRIRVAFSTQGERGRRSSRSPPRGRGGRPDLGEVKCFNCNGYGHYAVDCQFERNRGECYTCGEFGHQARDCRKSPRRMPKRRSGSRSRSRSKGKGSRRKRSGSRSASRGRRRSRSRDRGSRKKRSRSRSRSRSASGGQDKRSKSKDNPQLNVAHPGKRMMEIRMETKIECRNYIEVDAHSLRLDVLSL